MQSQVFYLNCKILRLKANLSPAKFSQLINEPEDTYKHIEEGKLQPQIEKIIDIAYLHRVSLDELLAQDLSASGKSSNLNEILRRKIINEICKYFGLKLFQVKTKTRGVREIAECRQLIYYFLYVNKLGSLEQIAADLGRYHYSVMHGIKVVQDLLTIDRVFKNNFNNISEIVKEVIDREVK